MTAMYTSFTVYNPKQSSCEKSACAAPKKAVVKRHEIRAVMVN